MRNLIQSAVAFTLPLLLITGCAKPTPEHRRFDHSAAIANELTMAREKLPEMRGSYSDQHPDVREQIKAIESLERSARTPGETLELAKAREQLARLRVNLADAHPEVQKQLRAVESLEMSTEANDPPDLAQAKAELARLRVDYSDAHPDVQSQLKKVADLQR